MADTLSAAAILRLRMLAQGLAGGTAHADATTQPNTTQPNASPPDTAQPDTSAGRIAATAHRMLAVQGQDWRSATWALGVRTPDSTISDVQDALNRGLIVRSWPMRGTLHLLAAADIGWLQQATNRRVLAGAAKRRAILGLSEHTLDRLVETSLAALQHGTSLDRDQLAEVWTEAGIQWQSNWRYHLIWWLCQNGLAVLGPVSHTGEPRLVLASDWIRAPRSLHGDAALCELAARYASARGVVTAADLAWWSGLTAAEAKRGLHGATDQGLLTQFSTAIAGRAVPVWADPQHLDAPIQLSDDDWLLLPAFDEHLLGYQERSPQLRPQDLAQIVPGRNGVFQATIVRGGRVVGTWKKGNKKLLELWGTALPEESLAAGARPLQQAATAWARFYGLGTPAFTSA